MITVNILINGECILARSATNIKTLINGNCQYKTDCNQIIEHNPDKGAIDLAHKLLDLIYEEGV